MVNSCSLVFAFHVVVKNPRFANEKLCKFFERRNREFLIISVNFVVTKNKRKRIDFFAFKFLSCKLPDEFKLVLGQSNNIFFFRNYSPLWIFSACAL